MKIILGSASPRRRELLSQIGLSFEVLVSKTEEIITSTIPCEVVEELSLQKARAVADMIKAGKRNNVGMIKDSIRNNVGMIKEGKPAKEDGNCVNDGILIIGADTIVASGNRILGKPKDEEDAFRMLSALQGRDHEVYTGVSLIYLGKDEKVKTFHEMTKVSFYPMTDEEIRGYIAGFDPMDRLGVTEKRTKCYGPEWTDKAGGYAIQGFCARFIRGIQGDYSNVVGLPLGRLYQEIKQMCAEITV